MAKECLHEDITPGMMAVIELTATKAAEAAITKYDRMVREIIPRLVCKEKMGKIACSEIKNHASECPLKKVYWTCMGGAAVISFIGSIAFQLALIWYKK